MRGSTNKSPIKLSMQWKIKYDKNSIRWFLRLPLSKFPQLSQVVKSKGILVPYTNLQLNPYPNTQLDLFSSDNFSFWCTTPSTWLTNCVDPNTRLQSPTREGCWLQSFSIHPNDENQEDAWSQNPTVHKHSNFFTRTMN